MQSMRTSNRLCRDYVRNCLPFKGSHLYGEVIDRSKSNGHVLTYVVYSYGTYWPLFLYVRGQNQWYANKDKCSLSTARHYSQANPYPYRDREHNPMLMLSAQQMRELVDAARADSFQPLAA